MSLMMRSPESMGLPCAAIYLACLMVFIPFPFSHYFEASLADTPLPGSCEGKLCESVGTRTFPLQEVRGASRPLLGHLKLTSRSSSRSTSPPSFPS
jgi:hypothetical protein